MPPRHPNAKAVAAKERKAAHKAEKDAESAARREKEVAKEWSAGANNRGASRAEAAAAKADEAARKKREKAALLAAEDEDGAGIKIKKAPGAGMKAKQSKKNKKGDGLALLEEALVGNAEKKSRQAKKAEREKKEREEKARKEREAKRKAENAKRDPLLQNTDAMLGEASTLDGDVGRSANVAAMADANATGIDNALGALSVGAGAEDDRHPEKRVKALHRAFEERMMPEMKEQYPGLRKAQYQEKIFQLWKKSPENPLNQVQ